MSATICSHADCDVQTRSRQINDSTTQTETVCGQCGAVLNVELMEEKQW